MERQLKLLGLFHCGGTFMNPGFAMQSLMPNLQRAQLCTSREGWVWEIPPCFKEQGFGQWGGSEMAQQRESRMLLLTVNDYWVWTTCKDNVQGRATWQDGLAPVLAQAHSPPESGTNTYRRQRAIMKYIKRSLSETSLVSSRHSGWRSSFHVRINMNKDDLWWGLHIVSEERSEIWGWDGEFNLWVLIVLCFPDEFKSCHILDVESEHGIIFV